MKLGILLAVVSIVIAVSLMFLISGETAGAAHEAEPVDLTPLIARIEALEKHAADARRASGEPKLETPGVARENVAPGQDVDLAARVTRAEALLAELSAKLEAQAAERERKPEAVKAKPADIDAITQRARDPRSSEADKLTALRELRALKLADGSDARLPVLDDMIALGLGSTDAATRTDVWRQLNHITDPRLKRALLDSLAYDKDGKTRAKACDTMKDFLPDPLIEAALRQALASDPSPDVKAQATQLLGGGGGH